MRALVFCLAAACVSTPAPAQHAAAEPAPLAAVVADASGPADDAAPRWIGVMFQQASATVDQVLGRSPAERAGLRRGDRIVMFDGSPVTGGHDVVAKVAQHAAHDTVDAVIERDGKQLTLHVTLEVRPDLEQVQRAQLLDKAAPPVALRTLANAPVDLAALKGRVVIVDFWATWCGPCRASLPMLEQWHTQLGAKGLSIIGITDEDPADVSAFLVDHKLDYTIALDPARTAWRDYLVLAVPTTIVIDRQGVVRFIQIGLGDGSEVEAALALLLK